MVEGLLYQIEKPGRYIGSEINAYRKNFEDAKVRIALAFPDVYEVGLSHLGLRLLYHALNEMEGVMADRAYAPWFDFEARLRESGEFLRGIESERPLKAFDFVGFSLQYELSYSNILTMLDLGGIALEAKDRREGDPWIIAGGPCAFNPEPLAEVLDFVVLGEAEEVFPELLAAFEQWRRSGGSRREFLETIRHIEGVYVPSFFEPIPLPDGTLAEIRPLYPDYTHVRKRLIRDLDQGAPVPEKPLVPMLDIVHNRLGLEIARGCTRGCRFCQAGFIYRPVRERHPQLLLEQAQKALANSGFEELSLLSLSTGDYCQVQGLLAALMERFAPEKVAVAFPSMRVGTLTPELMELVRQVRKTGFTLAPEAGSERLRRVINKGILDEDLLSAVQNAFRYGWRLLKLYFMIGLPTESPADLDALVDLSTRVWQLAKPSRSSVNIAVSTFVPKPHTPFQWAPQLSQEAVSQRLETLREKLRRPGIRFKWHHPPLSFLEAVFARGDRRLGKVLVKAWRLGARFDGWTEVFKEDVWKQAFEAEGIDPHFYALRERSLDEVLPWDHLSSGVEKEFLRKEYERACGEAFTPDCRWERCSLCGVCDHKDVKPRLHPEQEVSLETGPAPEPGEGQVLYWMRYSKLGKTRFFGQLELAQSFSRAIRRTGLPAAHSKGFHPHVKLSFLEALPLGLESRVEEAYLTLLSRVEPERLRTLLNDQLPEGVRIEAIAEVERRITRPQELRVTYRVSHLIPWAVRSILQNWTKRQDESLVKKTKTKEITSRLGEVLLDVRQLDESSLEMDLYEGSRLCVRPMVILQHLLGESWERFSECRICKTAVSRFAGLEGREDVRRAHHQR